jgi:hypothetical protein
MMGYGYNGTSIYDPFFDKAFWKLKFVWFPKRCSNSGKLIWLKNAYKGTRMITGPGEPVFEYRWYEKHEYLLLKIKGTL